MSERAETFQEEEITCPYCGYIHSDSWEAGESSDNDECEGCGKKFTWEKNVEISYTTYGDCDLNNEKHDLKLTNNGVGWVCEKCPYIKLKK